jgi:hypothetical protein
MFKKFLLLFFLILSLKNFAQCAMCRAALENSDNPVTAEAVNDGIVFLMAVPYLLVAIIAFVIYKIRSVKKV